MIKRFLFCINLLVYNILFALQVIEIAPEDPNSMRPRAVSVISNLKMNKEFEELEFKDAASTGEIFTITEYLRDKDSYYETKYENEGVKKQKQELEKRKGKGSKTKEVNETKEINETEKVKKNLQVCEYTKDKTFPFASNIKIPFTSNLNYVILRFPTTSTTGGSTFKYYSFKWEKKAFDKMNSTEKFIANYFNFKNKKNIEFLYSYKKSKADFWAIKVDGEIHAALWVKAQLSEVPNNEAKSLNGALQSDFLHPTQVPKGATIHVLVDSKNNILAKRINGVVTFKD